MCRKRDADAVGRRDGIVARLACRLVVTPQEAASRDRQFGDVLYSLAYLASTFHGIR